MTQPTDTIDRGSDHLPESREGYEAAMERVKELYAQLHQVVMTSEDLDQRATPQSGMTQQDYGFNNHFRANNRGLQIARSFEHGGQNHDMRLGFTFFVDKSTGERKTQPHNDGNNRIDFDKFLMTHFGCDLRMLVPVGETAVFSHETEVGHDGVRFSGIESGLLNADHPRWPEIKPLWEALGRDQKVSPVYSALAKIGIDGPMNRAELRRQAAVESNQDRYDDAVLTRETVPYRDMVAKLEALIAGMEMVLTEFDRPEELKAA